ncbi:MAG TPA: hypothetical protein VNT56_03145 [Acidimicrobiales bacterium]|nr:hypothetical protein [Acidimicrobiales bacterium]
MHPERHTRPWGMRLVATDPTGSEIAHVEEEQPEPLSLIAHAVAEVADTLVAIQRREESDAG